MKTFSLPDSNHISPKTGHIPKLAPWKTWRKEHECCSHGEDMNGERERN